MPRLGKGERRVRVGGRLLQTRITRLNFLFSLVSVPLLFSAETRIEIKSNPSIFGVAPREGGDEVGFRGERSPLLCEHKTELRPRSGSSKAQTRVRRGRETVRGVGME